MLRNYGLVHTLEELKSIVDKFLAEGTPVGLDIETGYDGPDRKDAATHPQEGFVVGISVANSTDWARYIPLRHDYAEENLDNKEVAEIIWPLLKSGLVIAHNAKFELSFLVPWLIEYLGIEIVGKEPFPIFSCTLIEAAIVSAYKSNALKKLVFEIFGHQMTEIHELFPDLPDSKKSIIRFNVLELNSKVIDYACEDALWALALHNKHYPIVKDHFIYKLEMQVLYVVYEMERFGVYFDWKFMRDVSEHAKVFKDIQLSNIQDTFSEMLGEPVTVNLNSPAQVQNLLYNRLGFSTTRYTKGTRDSTEPKMSTDTVALEGLAQKHPVIRSLLEWREVNKLIGSYLDKYERDFSYDIEHEGLTHPSHHQVFVISGRFSVSKPGYQQLPGGNISYKEGPLAGKKMTRYESGNAFLEVCFRDAVVCPEDYYAVGFDYGQAELRAIAGEANETALLEAFANGEDVHVKSAMLMFQIPADQVDPVKRQRGKTLNFATVYQQGIKALAESMGTSEEEAQDLQDRWYAAYPNIKRYIDKCMQLGRKNGYSITKFGRKMTIWDYQDKSHYAQGKADRMAFNTVIQGSATGDVPKIAMVRATKAIKAAGLADKIHLVMNIHDALEFYVHKSVDLDTVCSLLEPAVVFPVQGWPDMVADWHTWERWGSCKDIHKTETGKWELVA